MSAVCVAESKTTDGSPVVVDVGAFGHDDGFYYVNSEKGLLKVTGVAWLLRDSDGKKSGFCIENRIALTKAEQEEIGDSQPFMLPEDTYLPTGFTIEDEILANKYIEKMNAKGKKILFNNP